jgi:hypothetical protein
MTKEKVKLFKCYYCRSGSPKDGMIKVDSKSKTKNGGSIHRYYHPECLSVSKQNKVNENRRTGAYSNESVSHKQGKEMVLKWIQEGSHLIDQFGNEIMLNGDFYKIESPVTKEYKNLIPSQSDTCISCFKNYDLIQYDDDEMINLNELYERTGCHKKDNLHTCIKCPFNKLSYKMIFDIGIGLEGKYITAIEILNTSKVKDYKLKYCISNRIELFEISVDEIENNRPEQIKCNRLWWIENGKVVILDDYIK